MHLVDADGYKGGLWCLWSDRFKQVEVLEHGEQFIHLQIESIDHKTWEMTCVYASPRPSQRRALWQSLTDLAGRIQGPWCVGGDLNATLLSTERQSARETREPDRDFYRFIDSVSLTDLGFIGPPFTWKSIGNTSRIDWVLGSERWLVATTHRYMPILLPRSLEANYGLTEKLEKLQQQLWQELEKALLQESLIWAQKARSEWQINRDKNTRYYHTRANGHRRRNFIGALKDDSNAWIYDPKLIHARVLSFFTTLYEEEETHRVQLQCSVVFPPIDTGELNRMGCEISDIEIKDAIFHMGALKAPGPDILNALFYQSQWAHVGKSVCDLIQKLWR
ncbi:uncharacterized protein LOC114727282 [Neltuma alba]|uniref:uncharacterized protein LOC114727282 n=1 Tax=Neltuma alba TaxID=207710 RepID=UPI0010A53004|nr:uncharacterized protein LOC114727282 [Prosopis alba]